VRLLFVFEGKTAGELGWGLEVRGGEGEGEGEGERARARARARERERE